MGQAQTTLLCTHRCHLPYKKHRRFSKVHPQSYPDPWSCLSVRLVRYHPKTFLPRIDWNVKQPDFRSTRIQVHRNGAPPDPSERERERTPRKAAQLKVSLCVPLADSLARRSNLPAAAKFISREEGAQHTGIFPVGKQALLDRFTIFEAKPSASLLA